MKALAWSVAVVVSVGACRPTMQESVHDSPSTACIGSAFDAWLDAQCPGDASVRVTHSHGRSFDYTCDDMRELVGADTGVHEELNRVYDALFAARGPLEDSPGVDGQEGVGEAQQAFLSPLGAAFCGLFTLGFGLFMSRGVCSYPGAEHPNRCRDVGDLASVAFTIACIAPW